MINEKTTEKSLGAGLIKLRAKYFNNNHAVDFVTTEDILFSSSSVAADFVLRYKSAVAEEIHRDIHGELPEEKVIMADGTDITEKAKAAEKWLIEHSFF